MRRNKPIPKRTVKQKFVTQNYELLLGWSSPDGTDGNFFQTYIRFAPLLEGDGSKNLAIQLTNSLDNNRPCQVISTIPLGERTAWNEIYAKTRLRKVVFKYFPSCESATLPLVDETTGLTYQAGIGTANIVTTPIYSNVDDVCTNNNGNKFETDNSESWTNFIKKPYSRVHAINRPWTRILKPVLTTNYELYNTTTQRLRKSLGTPWLDMTSAGTTPGSTILLEGLNIMMQPIKIIQNNGNVLQFPNENAPFVSIGKISITSYQDFKTPT